MSVMRKVAAAAAGSLFLIGAVGAPAQAQPQIVDQRGLVNVNVGNVTVLEDVTVAVAANVAAGLCGIAVGPVVALAQDVETTGEQETVCDFRGQRNDVTISDS